MNDNSTDSNNRWSFGRDVLVFQFKLLADGLRDMVLIPASLIAGLLGLLLHRENPRQPFNQVLVLGKRSEYWINLFGSLPAEQQQEASSFVSRSGNVDELVGRLEDMLLVQYEKGGITASAKSSIDKSIDALHRGIDRVSSTRPDEDSQ